MLTIGRTQIENNYRVRVINNSTNEEETGISFNYQKSLSATELTSNKQQQQQQITENMKITSNNLEIRKLQLSDSGWYECQLPTKPTQINYVHLEVLSNNLYVYLYIYMALSINFQTGVWGEVYIAFMHVLPPPPPV